jgi:hypothetical protein
MPLYFLLLDARPFQEQIRPSLAAAWRQRSFEPCRSLCRDLLPVVRAFAERHGLIALESLLGQVARGLPFDRDYWTLLAGEVLLYAAREVPELEVAPETLCCLLAPERLGQAPGSRELYVPIEQAHFGSRDLSFGGKLYRPEQVGCNDPGDVARIAEYLGGVEPARWTPADLTPLTELVGDEERAEELAFVRDWFPALEELYRRAAEAGQAVVCEWLSSCRDY